VCQDTVVKLKFKKNKKSTFRFQVDVHSEMKYDNWIVSKEGEEKTKKNKEL